MPIFLTVQGMDDNSIKMHRFILLTNQTIEEKLAFLVQEGAVSEMQYLQHKAKVEEIKGQVKTSLVTLDYQELKSLDYKTLLSSF